MTSPIKQQRLSLAILILFGILFRESCIYLQKIHYASRVSSAEFPADKNSRLALGQKLDLREVDLYDLQKISGISISTAVEILERRHEIIANTDPDSGCPEFGIIKGIAEKKKASLCGSVGINRTD